jgi:hypothetical protein
MKLRLQIPNSFILFVLLYLYLTIPSWDYSVHLHPAVCQSVLTFVHCPACPNLTDYPRTSRDIYRYWGMNLLHSRAGVMTDLNSLRSIMLIARQEGFRTQVRQLNPPHTGRTELLKNETSNKCFK